jgi:biotin-dependent carboxylase-like uncharacterized protein
MSMRVLKPGLLTTSQDMGRKGQARFGVAPSGAMDRNALRLANGLVGNAPDAAALELTLLGPTLEFQQSGVIALTGAEIDARVEAQQLPMWRPLYVPSGSVLKLGGMRRGARSYLTIAGGFKARRWLGSASVDLNAGIGEALRAGDTLEFNAMPAPDWLKCEERLAWPTWSLAPAYWLETERRPLRLVAGVHFDTLTRAAQKALFSERFSISKDSNRVGFRLQGVTLELSKPLELVSEAVDFGTLQLPPSGDPIILMAEHPSSGGYPRIAQIAAVDLAYLAQRKPGEHLHFERIDADQAERLLIEQERALTELVAETARRLGAGGD